MILILLRVLHIAIASVWLSANATFTGDVKKTLNAGEPHTQLLLKRAKMFEILGLPMGIATFATGFLLIMQMGGMGAVHKGIHISLLLVLLAVVVEGAMILPTWRKIADIIKSSGDLEEAKKLSKKLTMFTGIEHLLRTVVLVLMIWK
jgi:hypothetical protein